jgi:hypothetical protein
MTSAVRLAVFLVSVAFAFGLPARRAAAAQGGVIIMQSSAYQDERGRVSVVGELRNDTADEIALVALTATFFDASGAVLDRAEGISLVPQLLPGETAPFVVDTGSAAAAGFDRYEIAESHFEGGFGPVIRDLPVSVEATTPLPDGRLRLDGHITNTTGGPVLVTWVAVALCDEAGTVLRAAAGAVYETLAPDERAAFAIVYESAAIEYSRYRTWVSAHPAP